MCVQSFIPVVRPFIDAYVCLSLLQRQGRLVHTAIPTSICMCGDGQLGMGHVDYPRILVAISLMRRPALHLVVLKRFFPLIS